MTHEERKQRIQEFTNGLSHVHLLGTDTYFTYMTCPVCKAGEGGDRHEYRALVTGWDEWTDFCACTACTMEMEYPGEEYLGMEAA